MPARAEGSGRGLRWAGGALPLLVAASLALGACGGDDEEPETGALPPPRERVEPDEPTPGSEERSRRDRERRDGARERGGGSGEERGRERRDAAEVVEAIEAVLASGDADLACADAVTVRYVERSWGTGQACRLSQDPEIVATRALVHDVSMGDGRATATVDVEGGLYDGMELDARVIYEAGAWRVDRLSADVPPGP